MANERYGNQYFVVLKKETTFGTDAELNADTTVLPDKLEVSGEAPEMIELGAKDDYIVPYAHTKIAGLKHPKVTLTGELTNTHDILWEMLTGDSSSAYTITDQNSVNSYTIAKAWEDGDGAACDLYLGCTLESLTVSGSVGGAITYSATFRAKSVDRETTDDFGAGNPTLPELTPYTYHNITDISIAGDNIANCNSFEFSWNREYPDNKFLFNNSQTMSSVLQCRITGQFTANYPYSSSLDSNVFDNLANGTTYLQSITVGDGTNTCKIDMYGQYTDYSTPDPDRCIFEGNYTVEMMYDGTNQGTTVTITNA